MKIRAFGILGCVMAMALSLGCASAHAGTGYVGMWKGMKNDKTITIASTNGKDYVATMHEGFKVYMTKRDGVLYGTVEHNPQWRVTIRFDGDANHIFYKFPTNPLETQEYERVTGSHK